MTCASPCQGSSCHVLQLRATQEASASVEPQQTGSSGGLRLSEILLGRLQQQNRGTLSTSVHGSPPCSTLGVAFAMQAFRQGPWAQRPLVRLSCDSGACMLTTSGNCSVSLSLLGHASSLKPGPCISRQQCMRLPLSAKRCCHSQTCLTAA